MKKNNICFKKHASIYTAFLLAAVFMLSSASAVNIVNSDKINEENNLDIHKYACGQSGSPPTVVEFDGPSSINIGETATFYVKGIDPNGLYIKYLFDWKIYPPYQDFNVDDETPYYGSGTTIMIQHTFNVGGNYYVAVIAKNIDGKESEIAFRGISVNGGEAILGITDVWTKPDRFIPNQKVSFYLKAGNSGNRDAYGGIPINLYVYIDGERVYAEWPPKTVFFIEAGTYLIKCSNPVTWPNDFNVHKIEYRWGSETEYYTAYLNKSAVENEPPLKPSIKGPLRATSGKVYPCYSSTTDPNEHKIYYLFDFGDGLLSGWLGPYDSGQTAETSHKWYNKGAYELRVKARDEYGLESEWSDPFRVHVTTDKTVNIIMNQQEDYQNFQQPAIGYATTKIGGLLIKKTISSFIPHVLK